MKVIKLLTMGLLSLFLLLSGCQKEQAGSEKSLSLCFMDDPGSLDPRFGYEIPANHTIRMLFEGLMRYTPDGELTPAQARFYTVSEDEKT